MFANLFTCSRTRAHGTAREEKENVVRMIGALPIMDRDLRARRRAAARGPQRVSGARPARRSSAARVEVGGRCMDPHRGLLSQGALRSPETISWGGVATPVPRHSGIESLTAIVSNELVIKH